tara:strand:- start:1410 stop:4574 length:3165 start_codon:yes stop_codon:yes gene_type:complete
MDKKLLLEGAVAGHMNHIYDNGEMTFGELKQLLQAIADGKIRGTEKTDGQNIFLSFNVRDQKAKAIRNKTQIKAGGLDVEEFDDFFSEHPSQALRASFVEALQAFEDAIKQIDEETQEKIFGQDNEVYFNTEVMNPGTPGLEEDDPRAKGTTNVIPYDKKTLLIHRVGHGAFDKETAKKLETDISTNFDVLEQSIMGMATDDPTQFSVETNQIKKLPPMKGKEIVPATISEIDNLVRDQDLNDQSTINDYVISQVVPIINNFGLTEDRNKMILKRLMMATGGPTLRQITSGIPSELSDEISTFIKSFKYAEYTRTLQKVLHDFSVAAIDGLESAFISDNERQIKFLQSELQKSITKIQNSSNERAKEELFRQLVKLKSAKGINTPSEGFVFNWNGVTYKLTGNFAPANQILGMERFQRFGPIEPATDSQLAAQGETGPLTIAILPGSFKPPHKGHLRALEAIEQRAGGKSLPEIDKYLVIISNPSAKDDSGGLKSSRPLPMSGKVITADQAKQMWSVMLDKSPIKNKVQLVTGDANAASPMLITYQFVQNQPDPTNLLIAPKNANVVLVVGDKEDDAKRFGGMREKVAEKRPDIKLFPGVVPVAKHDSEYVSFMKDPNNQMIRSRMKSNFDDFNASDMRFIMDFASQDPIGLELLKFYVPYPEDALAYMGIMGLNPADEKTGEEDQVQEPEINPEEVDVSGLQEIVFSQAEIFYEGFKAQRAPKAGPSKSKFQRRMRKRLSKSHRTYLDMGAGPKGHHGGGFRLSRNKKPSNAFLAEEEIEEMSSVAGGSVQGFAGPIGSDTNTFKRKDKKMKKEEQKLRKHIRISLQEFFNKKAIEHENAIAAILEEHQLRMQLRNIILEQTIVEQEDPTTDVSDSTGINTLKDLFKNTNILSTLRTVYKTLTTNDDQKRSFRAHILKWTVDTLAPVKLNDTDAQPVSEQVDVDIIDTDRDKFIDAPDGSEKETQPEPEEPDTMQPISGEDTTGRNKAERVYPTIEKSIVDYYGELDNPDDQEMFYDYLIANLKLYFDKWDGEMSTGVQEPTNDEYEQAKQAV